MTAGIDKRRHHRFKVRLAVQVGSSGDLPADLTLATVDISLGGARCSSNVSLRNKVQLHLTLTLEGGRLREPLPIQVEAEVTGCIMTPSPNPNRRFELTLRFVDIDRQDKRSLQSYLNSL